MTINQLTDFYALTAKCDREAQKQADCFITQAINLSLEGDAVMAGEMLLEAHRIITDTLERDKQCKCTAYEMKRFVADVEAICVGSGGLYD